jgi:hypothetical protein
MSTPWGDWHGPKNSDGSWVSLDQVKARLKNSGTPGEFDSNLTDLLAVHAHELAEKIRTECGCLGGSGTCEIAADRIDPQTDDHWAPESGTT